MRRVIESLEARLLLSVVRPPLGDIAVLLPEPTLAPQRELEPNNSFDTANEIELRPSDPCVVPSGVARPCVLETAALDRLGGAGERWSGRVAGALAVEQAATGRVFADTDFFRIAVHEGDSVAWRAEGAASRFATLTVFDEEGTELAQVGPHNGQPYHIELTAEADGTLFARLAAAATTGADSPVARGRYTLGVEIAAPQVDPFVEIEPNDTLDTATPLQEAPHGRPDCAPNGFCRPGILPGDSQPPRDELPPDVGICMIGVPSPCNAPEYSGMNDRMGVMQRPPADLSQIIGAVIRDPAAIGELLRNIQLPIDPVFADRLHEIAASFGIDLTQLGPDDLAALYRQIAGPDGTISLDDIPPERIDNASHWLDNAEPTDVQTIVEQVLPDGINPATGIDVFETAQFWVGHDVVRYLAHGTLGFEGTAGSDVDYYSFSTEADRAIRVAYHGLPGVTPILLDGDGNPVAVEGGPQCDDEPLSCGVLEYFARDGGLFYLQIGPATDPSGEPLDYGLTVAAREEPNVEHEPNDTPEQANPIAFQGRGCGEFCIVATGNTDPGDGAMDLGAPDRPGHDHISPTIFPPPWADDRAHGFIEGSIAARPEGTDTDYFSFDTAAERRIGVHVEGAALPVLLDSAGNELATGEGLDFDDDGVADAAVLSYYSRTGGEFLVRLEGIGTIAEDQNYRIDVNISSEPNLEHEPNNTADTANDIVFQSGFGWDCERICPLADAAGVVANRPGRVPPVHGFISGQIDSGATGSADVDFFRVEVPAERDLVAALHGPLGQNGGQITVFDAGGNELGGSGEDGAVRVPAIEGGVFFIRVDQQAELNVDPLICDPTTGDPNLNSAGIIAEPCDGGPEINSYTVDVTLERHVNPAQGADEHEPNDAFETASVVRLEPLPVFAPGLELRAGSSRAIAGGPGDDVDVFQIDARAGEHLNVGIEGAGKGGRPAHIRQADLLDSTLALIVYDAAGNEIGRSGTAETDSVAVVFDAETDGTYFARVEVVSEGDAFVNYRLGVFAQKQYVRPPVEPPIDDGPPIDDEPVEGDPGEGDGVQFARPMEMELEPGDSYQFTDATGDVVRVAYHGRGGAATIRFTGSDADGSDISSVVVEGARARGRVVVRSVGSAEVGSVEIHGRRFGRVVVDGNLGSLISNVNLRAIDVDGVLGALDADGHEVRKLRAGVFDAELARVDHVRDLQVEQHVLDALFERFQPWNDDADQEEGDLAVVA
jgi:hypothetical protein